MSDDLPSPLLSALDGLIEGRARAEIAERAAAISETYRSGGSSAVIASSVDALAYALVRMPATYAAVTCALTALRHAAPGFAPTSLIDVGAGPGTASFAAAAVFPSLVDIDLIDHNAHLQRLAKTLLAASDSDALREARCDRVEAVASLAGRDGADLLVASYAIGEIPADLLPAFVDTLWARAHAMLVVIEPGTPAGFERIRALRARLIAQDAHVLAPCPHDHPCPIIAPDWCHFARRLARSRAHRQLKGVTLAYEDEKFAYVALTRDAGRSGPQARVLAPPRVGKVAITTKLCRADGAIAAHTAARRDREAYRAYKHLRWGDVVDQPTDRESET
jgi:ribosomal protein RSM22 (predicted rRNA methylase)